MERGILFVATGEEFVREAELAVKTVSEVMPGVPTAIVTAGDADPRGFDSKITLSNPVYSFQDKISGLQNSPFEKTVFLDTDTYVCEPFSELFDILEKFDVAATHNQNRDLYSQSLGIPSSFPEYNTGVLAFNSSKTVDLFDAWETTYSAEHDNDQPAFRKALFGSDIRLATLPREYNCLIRSPGHVTKSVKIFHGRTLDIGTPGAHKYYQVEEAERRINQFEGHRLFTRGGYILDSDPPLSARLKNSLRMRGPTGTARYVLQKFSQTVFR